MMRASKVLTSSGGVPFPGRFVVLAIAILRFFMPNPAIDLILGGVCLVSAQ